ncbi:hypothetical protein Rhopal_000697-T1 [Rhodotorula paludigena]|uniref:Uncharacterized protein n=1 Tax=Rhodotorula paludigena TaxID=86838 RepID=A0AAV5GFA2_9BASI|nr:hypothetical protein Rhopal_000697-T1 [Rhodotorula paludigena]
MAATPPPHAKEPSALSPPHPPPLAAPPLRLAADDSHLRVFFRRLDDSLAQLARLQPPVSYLASRATPTFVPLLLSPAVDSAHILPLVRHYLDHDDGHGDIETGDYGVASAVAALKRSTVRAQDAEPFATVLLDLTLRVAVQLAARTASLAAAQCAPSASPAAAAAAAAQQNPTPPLDPAHPFANEHRFTAAQKGKGRARDPNESEGDERGAKKRRTMRSPAPGTESPAPREGEPGYVQKDELESPRKNKDEAERVVDNAMGERDEGQGARLRPEQNRPTPTTPAPDGYAPLACAIADAAQDAQLVQADAAFQFNLRAGSVDPKAEPDDGEVLTGTGGEEAQPAPAAPPAQAEMVRDGGLATIPAIKADESDSEVTDPTVPVGLAELLPLALRSLPADLVLSRVPPPPHAQSPDFDFAFTRRQLGGAEISIWSGGYSAERGFRPSEKFLAFQPAQNIAGSQHLHPPPPSGELGATGRPIAYGEPFAIVSLTARLREVLAAIARCATSPRENAGDSINVFVCAGENQWLYRGRYRVAHAGLSNAAAEPLLSARGGGGGMHPLLEGVFCAHAGLRPKDKRAPEPWPWPKRVLPDWGFRAQTLGGALDELERAPEALAGEDEEEEGARTHCVRYIAFQCVGWDDENFAVWDAKRARGKKGAGGESGVARGSSRAATRRKGPDSAHIPATPVLTLDDEGNVVEDDSRRMTRARAKNG